MASLEAIPTAAHDAWMQALQRCPQHDFYHLPQYHAMAEEAGEGAARLLLYTEGDYLIALPLLFRVLDEIVPDSPLDAGWYDATSVYGYAGPVCSHAEIPL